MAARRRLWFLGVPAGVLLLAAILLWPLGYRKTLRSWWYWRGGPHHGRFQDPEGLAMDARGILYVGDEKRATISLIDAAGATTRTYSPVSGNRIVLLAPGRFLVFATRDQVDHVVEVDLQAGREVRAFTAPPAPGMPPFAPEGLDLDRATGEIFVSDEDGRRVVVFSADGAVARSFPVDGLPEDLRLFEDRVYITMPKSGWVLCYGKDGSFRSRFGKDELVQPETTAVSPDRKVYVSDNKGHKIEVYDLEGRHFFTIGGPGRAPGRFNRPQDILFGTDGNLYVADSDNHRVQVLTPAGAPLRIIE